MQIIQIHAHASKVRRVRESGFWDEPDDDITQIVPSAPVTEMGKEYEEKECDTNRSVNQNTPIGSQFYSPTHSPPRAQGVVYLAKHLAKVGGLSLLAC
jgi:hypothetical protein